MQFLHDKNQALRFPETALNSLTQAQLKELRQLFPGVKSSDKVVLAFQEKWDPHTMGMNAAELEIIGLQLVRLAAGTSVRNSAYEERTFPQGGTVEYSPSKISIVSKTNDTLDIPNFPLAPAEPIQGRGKDRLVMILASFFDFDASQLRTIRDATLDYRFFGNQATNYNPLGVVMLQRAVSGLLSDNAAYKGTFTIKKTITGHEATDFWYAFVETLSKKDFFALHTIVIQHLLRHITMKPDASTQRVRPHVQRERGVDGQLKDPKIPMTAFYKMACPEYQSEGYEPVVLNAPINPVATMIRKVTAPRELIALYKESVTLRGGNKRGVGMVSQYIDYCPRQSNTIRRLNWFVMAISNIGAACDVHAEPGDLTLLNVWIAQNSQLSQKAWIKDIRICISLADTKGQERKQHYIEQPRKGTPQVVIMDWFTLPEILAGEKKREANDTAIEESATKFLNITTGYGRYFVLAPCFSPRQFGSSWHVFRHGKGHDLQAVFTNICPRLIDPFGAEWQLPITWENAAETSRLAIRYMNAWMFCGEPIYNTLGQWYRPPDGILSVEDGQWSFKEVTPFIPAPKHHGTVDDDEELPSDDTSFTNSSASERNTMTAVFTGLQTVSSSPVELAFADGEDDLPSGDNEETA